MNLWFYWNVFFFSLQFCAPVSFLSGRCSIIVPYAFISIIRYEYVLSNSCECSSVLFRSGYIDSGPFTFTSSFDAYSALSWYTQPSSTNRRSQVMMGFCSLVLFLVHHIRFALCATSNYSLRKTFTPEYSGRWGTWGVHLSTFDFDNNLNFAVAPLVRHHWKLV